MRNLLASFGEHKEEWKMVDTTEIIFKKEISEAQDPAAKLLEKENEYAQLFANPYTAAQRGFIDEVILPKDTRRKLLKAFSMLENKEVVLPKRKHGNIPL
jgi:propionyl-CoA carboxylase beta chain